MSSLFYLARRFKTATALNLLGLTVAFAAFYLFMTQVLYNAGYNRGIPDAERLFRVEAKMNLDAPWDVNCNRPVLEMMMQLPEVEAGTIVPRWGCMQEVYQGETPVECAAAKIHGESSLLNILGLLDNPTEGEYWLDDKEVGHLKERQRTLTRRGEIGFVFQSPLVLSPNDQSWFRMASRMRWARRWRQTVSPTNSHASNTPKVWLHPLICRHRLQFSCSRVPLCCKAA